MAYALVSKTNGRRTLWVQVPPPAFIIDNGLEAKSSAIGPRETGRLRVSGVQYDAMEEKSHLRHILISENKYFTAANPSFWLRRLHSLLTYPGVDKRCRSFMGSLKNTNFRCVKYCYQRSSLQTA